MPRRRRSSGWRNSANRPIRFTPSTATGPAFTPREQALFTVAKNLAASPVVLTDAEVAKALDLAGPRDVVQMITYTTNRASFDRITEAAGLAIEE